MTFVQLQSRLYKSVQRDDYLVANSPETNYGTFINEALRGCQNRKNWTFMKETVDLTILASQSDVDLPEDFKAFQNLRPPVHIVLTDPATNFPVLRPVNVTWAEQELRRAWMMGSVGVGTVTWDLQCFTDRTSGTTKLSIVTPAGSDIIFRVKYYGYLPALVEDSDTSILVDRYQSMVIAKAKEIAFEQINDYDARNNSEGEFEKKFMEASKQDNYDDVSGREGRM